MKTIFNEHPLIFSILIGLLLRIFAGLYNYTPLAEDDYANVLAPALKSLQLSVPIETVNYRLPILPFTVYIVLYPFYFLGLQDTIVLMRIAHVFLGILSVFGIWGAYKLGDNFLNNQYRNYFSLFYALYFLMPLISSRALLGSFTLITIPWAFYFLTKKTMTSKEYFWGAFFLGLTVLLRFQTGIIALVVTVYIFISRISSLDKNKIIFYFLGGAVGILLLALFDIIFHRFPLSTILNYFLLNFSDNIQASNYGSAPWFTYILTLSSLFIPPISFILLWSFLKIFFQKKVRLLSISLFAYVFFHSLIQNKLERFIIPIIPLFFIISFIGFESMKDKKIIKISLIGFIIINFILLLPITFTKSQNNIIEAASYLRDKKEKVYFKNINLFKKAYLGFDKPSPINIKNIQDIKEKKFLLLNLLKLQPEEIEFLKKQKITCEVEKSFEPAFLEKIVIFLNPKFNKRRDTTYLYNCK